MFNYNKYCRNSLVIKPFLNGRRVQLAIVMSQKQSPSSLFRYPIHNEVLVHLKCAHGLVLAFPDKGASLDDTPVQMKCVVFPCVAPISGGETQSGDTKQQYK